MRMTFTFPNSLADDFQTLVAPGERSSLLARLLEEELRKRREVLVHACQQANQNQDVEKLVDDWQSFDERVDGPGW